MTSIKIELDRAILGQVPGKLSNFSTVLDKFVQRAATEAGRTMKLEAPKALTTLTNSVVVEREASGSYLVRPTANYAAAVNAGARPHKPPLMPLVLWLKYTKRVSDQHELQRRARGLQRAIARNGTRANPFLQRTAAASQSRAMQLVRKGVAQAASEAFSK